MLPADVLFAASPLNPLLLQCMGSELHLHDISCMRYSTRCAAETARRGAQARSVLAGPAGGFGLLLCLRPGAQGAAGQQRGQPAPAAPADPGGNWRGAPVQQALCSVLGMLAQLASDQVPGSSCIGAAQTLLCQQASDQQLPGSRLCTAAGHPCLPSELPALTQGRPEGAGAQVERPAFWACNSVVDLSALAAPDSEAGVPAVCSDWHALAGRPFSSSSNMLRLMPSLPTAQHHAGDGKCACLLTRAGPPQT